MGWGTVPPNDPRNGQIRAFSCTVAERVIRLRRFSQNAIKAIKGLVALIAGDELDWGWHSEDDDEWYFQHNIY